MNNNKLSVILAGVIFTITIISTYFETLSGVWEDYKIGMGFKVQSNVDKTIETLKERKILLWTSMFEDEYFYLGKTGQFDHCPKYNNCLLTRSRESITDSEAVLFHGNELVREDLPKERDPRQYYVFVNLESPINRPITDSYYEDYFNLTMTYRLDSDIPWPYNMIKNIQTGETVAPVSQVRWMEPVFGSSDDDWVINIGEKFKNRKKTAAWLVSNCQTPGKRESYIEELRKYVDIDVIGKCSETSPIKCPRSEPWEDCFTEIIEKDYLFYLSFENSLCQDYVTEKLFNPLRYNIIPVVYGGGNYSLFAPPHSYIDALDFGSPKRLANYLNHLSQSQEEYAKYFWWKKFYAVDYSRFYTLCKICEIANEPKTPRIYSPLSDWYAKDKCPIHDALNDLNFATKYARPRALK